MLQRRIRQIAVAAGLLTALIAGCGGNSDVDYSATRFSECLSARDLAPEKMDTSPSSERYVDALARIGAEAARQNGALEAFANDAMPGASTLYFLFFDDADSARDGQQDSSASRVTSRPTTNWWFAATCSPWVPSKPKRKAASSTSA
jgi:hypothetical protein